MSNSKARLRCGALAAAGLFLAGSTALSQQPAKRTSVILGIAVDSLHGRPLSGAEAIITRVDRMIITDSLGRFRVDSLPAGTYQVGLFHPLLDSLGISLSSPEFTVGADSATLVRLAVPSVNTLLAASCKARVRPLGNSAIFGRLTDPDTFEPVPNAEVSIAWTQIDVSPQIGVKQTPRLIRDSTDANGVFHLCGLPAELDAKLQANYRGVLTADVPVQTSASDGDFIIRALYVSKKETAGARAGSAIVAGRVTFAGGQPAPGSRVEIVGTSAVGITNEQGEFTLSGVTSGTQMLRVRHLGWMPREVPVDLSAAKPQRVAVQLQKYVPMMDPVVVTARNEKALEKVGFSLRKKSGTGHFITGDELARRQPAYLSDALRTVPGLTVRTRGTRTEIASTRGGGLSGGGCVLYFVDGFRFQNMGGDANDFVHPSEVAAIEVYQPSFAPPEFSDAGGRSCVTIVIWTKQKIR